MSSRITILDYGVGNLHSVWHACRKFSEEVRVISDISEYLSTTHLVLPGVGAFDVAISEIRNRKFDKLIKEAVDGRTPILGVCIGMHVLARIGFENGENHGLSIFDAEVRHLAEQNQIKEYRIPHIGWTRVERTNNDTWSPIGSGNSAYFYFAHSYGYFNTQNHNVLGEVVLGELRIPAVVKSGNTIGVQFHPEKSGSNGLNFLKTFFDLEASPSET